MWLYSTLQLFGGPFSYFCGSQNQENNKKLNFRTLFGPSKICWKEKLKEKNVKKKKYGENKIFSLIWFEKKIQEFG